MPEENLSSPSLSLTTSRLLRLFVPFHAVQQHFEMSTDFSCCVEIFFELDVLNQRNLPQYCDGYETNCELS